MKIDHTKALIVISVLALGVIGALFYFDRSSNLNFNLPILKKISSPGETPKAEEVKAVDKLTPVVAPLPAAARSVKKFVSKEEFTKYVAEGRELLSGYGYFGAGIGGARTSGLAVEDMALPIMTPSAKTMNAQEGSGGGGAERVSETNVQVLGIDEADVVKTNGKEIFFSKDMPYYRTMGMEKMMIAPDYYQPKAETKIITAFPPENLALLNKIEKGGEMLLSGNFLTIFSGNNIYGYDISDLKAPKEAWKVDFENNSYLVSSRLYKDKVYAVTAQYINDYTRCPVRPMSVNGTAMEIRCVDIYHPVQTVPVDVTYTAVTIDPATGKIEKTVSFVGPSGSTIIYMSEGNLYVSYSYNADLFPLMSQFYTEELKDLLPDAVRAKIKKLSGYDISSQSKINELAAILEAHDRNITDDDRLKLANEVENRGESFFKKHLRELEYTGIAKISLDDFSVKATGRVPGRTLNQFSLDEYEGSLRVATTLSGNMMFGFGRGESVNDVYVLNSSLDIVGLAKDMGLSERIYSVRFLGKRGYVVTFRQTDPFYVLDLSDPKNPLVKGQLKIPGYSSYLHPLSDNRILGVGMEGSNVKLSLFDVSSAEDPKEISKYVLKEYWSEVSNTHHAFLQDKKHNVFFMPGSQGGYVFSYLNDAITLKKAVSGISARRALYLNDYLYLVSDNKVVVVNENTWETVKELELD